MTATAWRNSAACKGQDPNDFFPSGSQETEERASSLRGTCARCEVRQECLDDAVRTGALGWWGGTSEEERSRSRRRPEKHASEMVLELVQELQRRLNEREEVA